MKVHIDLDIYKLFVPQLTLENRESGNIDIPEELFNDYSAMLKRILAMNEYFEHAFRHQQGLKPYQESPWKEEGK